MKPLERSGKLPEPRVIATVSKRDETRESTKRGLSAERDVWDPPMLGIPPERRDWEFASPAEVVDIDRELVSDLALEVLCVVFGPRVMRRGPDPRSKKHGRPLRRDGCRVRDLEHGRPYQCEAEDECEEELATST